MSYYCRNNCGAQFMSEPPKNNICDDCWEMENGINTTIAQIPTDDNRTAYKKTHVNPNCGCVKIQTFTEHPVNPESGEGTRTIKFNYWETNLCKEHIEEHNKKRAETLYSSCDEELYCDDCGAFICWMRSNDLEGFRFLCNKCKPYEDSNEK